MAASHSKVKSPKNKSVKSITVPKNVLSYIQATAKSKEKVSPVTQLALDIVTECWKQGLNIFETQGALEVANAPLGEGRVNMMRKVLKKKGKLALGSEYLRKRR